MNRWNGRIRRGCQRNKSHAWWIPTTQGTYSPKEEKHSSCSRCHSYRITRRTKSKRDVQKLSKGESGFEEKLRSPGKQQFMKLWIAKERSHFLSNNQTQPGNLQPTLPDFLHYITRWANLTGYKSAEIHFQVSYVSTRLSKVTYLRVFPEGIGLGENATLFLVAQ